MFITRGYHDTDTYNRRKYEFMQDFRRKETDVDTFTAGP